MSEQQPWVRVKELCRVLGVSRSGYYRWRTQLKSRRAESNERLLESIGAIYRQHRGTYGSPSITDALHQLGWRCGKNRVARLMRLHGIRAKTKRRFRVTTHSTGTHSAAPNLVQRQFCASASNRLWCSDITYVWTREGWLYLAMVLDVYSRRIVGYALGARLTATLVTEALERAIRMRTATGETIFHSDRGSQYASRELQALLQQHGLRQSMSSTGSCYDNAMAESFFHTLKTELIYWERYETRAQAAHSIFEYIEIFYNRHRRHSELGYRSPVDFEQLHS